MWSTRSFRIAIAGASADASSFMLYFPLPFHVWTLFFLLRHSIELAEEQASYSFSSRK